MFSHFLKLVSKEAAGKHPLFFVKIVVEYAKIIVYKKQAQPLNCSKLAKKYYHG